VLAQSMHLNLTSSKTKKSILLLFALCIIFVLASNLGNTFQVFWIIGLSVGFTLQRSRLCFASGFRDLFLMKQGSTMKGIILGLIVAIAGFSMIMSTIYPEPNGLSIPTDANILPVGLATLIGGILFGVGMVVAGGCVSGSLYRMGEGYLTSWIAMIGIILGTTLLNHSWNWWWDFSIKNDPLTWLPNELGYTFSILLSLVILGICYIGILKIESSVPKFNIPISNNTGQNNEDSQSGVMQSIVPAYKAIFKNGWSPTVGAIVLGIINIVVFIRFSPLGVVGEISRWGASVGELFGLTTPSLKGIAEMGGCALPEMVKGNFFAHNHFFLNAGIVIGSFSGAFFADEFKLRISKSLKRYLQSFFGGIFMGYGAGLAIGCTIGAFFSSIPSLAISGWVFAFALFIGAYLGSKIITRLM
tara:strand:+ start:4319 stop:5566 length:1248 start_codon:yes stop_codon:yes gene_type:complete